MSLQDQSVWRFESVGALRHTETKATGGDPKDFTIEPASHRAYVDRPSGQVYVPIYEFRGSVFVQCSGETHSAEPCFHLDATARSFDSIDTVQSLDGVYGEPREPRLHYEAGEQLVAVSSFGGSEPFIFPGDPTPRLFTICQVKSTTD